MAVSFGSTEHRTMAVREMKVDFMPVEATIALRVPTIEEATVSLTPISEVEKLFSGLTNLLGGGGSGYSGHGGKIHT